jgi:hypothetical protein
MPARLKMQHDRGKLVESIIVAPPLLRLNMPPKSAPAADAPTNDTNVLLSHLIELQREQVALMRRQVLRNDDHDRVKQLHERHGPDFAPLPTACQQVLPQLERRYLELLNDLTERLEDADDLDSEFALAEFLDRFGPRLMQLGHIINQVGTFANLAAKPAGVQASGES